MSEQKDYYNVRAMSAQFRKWDGDRAPEEQKPQNIKLWELRFQLAIAQQLTIISAHLGAIVGKAKGE
jgi:hypothetical protein